MDSKNLPVAQTTRPDTDSKLSSDLNVEEQYSMDQSFTGKNQQITTYRGSPYPKEGITHLKMSGDFLYWTSGYDLAYGLVGSDTTTINRTLLTFGNKYQPGCRIGLGYAFDPQGWDVTGNWVCFRNNKSVNLKTTSSQTIYLDWSSVFTSVTPFPPGQFDRQHSIWQLHYNELDFEIGYQIYFSKYFSLRPNTGFRYLHINDLFTVDYFSTVSTLTNNMTMKNKMHGFGFSFGFDNKFLFGYGLFLLANLKSGLVFSNSYVKTPALINEIHDGFFGTVNVKNSHEMIPVIDTRIDLGWERSFCNNQFSLALTGGYEYHVLIDGFMAILQANTSGSLVYPYQKTNLYMHGMNLGAQINF